MEEIDYEYSVLNGSIEEGQTYATEVSVVTPDQQQITLTFEEPVAETDLDSVVIPALIQRISEAEDEPDFDYTKAKRFRDNSQTAEALVEMFHICPFTTNQYSDYSELEYASSYPSKLRDKGLVKSIGRLGTKTIWVLTPVGIKEALCLMGHPAEVDDLIGIRQPNQEAGLDGLFDDIERRDDEDEQ